MTSAPSKNVTRWKCVGYCRHCTVDEDESTFVREWGHFEKSDDGVWVRADSALAEIERLRAALAMVYDKWEDGDPCYEDADPMGSFMGNAFKLSEAEENQILALLPRERGAAETGLKPGCGSNDTGYHRPNSDGKCSDCDEVLP